MHANVNVFDAVSKTAVISCISLHLTKKHYQNVQLNLLQHHTKFHSGQLKSERETEVKRFCFVLTLWPSATVKVSECGI